MALSKIQTGLVDTNAVGATELNLADDFAFTGDVSGAGWHLLATYSDDSSGSSTNYDSDTEIFNINPFLSDYHTFAFQITVYPDSSSGSQHLWFNVGATLRYANSGYQQAGSVATPAVGSGGYYRWAFQAQGNTRAFCEGFIIQGQKNDVSMDTMFTTQSGWYYEGTGAATANGTAYVDNSVTIGTLRINIDEATSGGGRNAWIQGKLWGIM